MQAPETLYNEDGQVMAFRADIWTTRRAAARELIEEYEWEVEEFIFTEDCQINRQNYRALVNDFRPMYFRYEPTEEGYDDYPWHPYSTEQPDSVEYWERTL